MTRPFNALIRCPKCGYIHTEELAVKRWVRNNQNLDSRDGIVFFDCDLIVHKYKNFTDKNGSREIQGLMVVEIKTHDADLSEAQRDTLWIFDQALRNRRTNKYHRKIRSQLRNHATAAIATSFKAKKKIRLRLYGAHVWRLENDDPDNSKWMTWDGQRINKDQLIALLRLDLDPDSLGPIDLRRHHIRGQTEIPYSSDHPIKVA